jgi:hypothetical protein
VAASHLLRKFGKNGDDDALPPKSVSWLYGSANAEGMSITPAILNSKNYYKGNLQYFMLEFFPKLYLYQQ